MPLIRSVIPALVLASAFAHAAPARAQVDIAGVRFPAAVEVRGQRLELNGAALRTMSVFRVYAIALYLGERRATAHEVLGSRLPKRVRLAMLREVTAAQLSNALVEGIRDNHPPAEFERLRGRIDRLARAMTSVGVAPPGSHIDMDFVPGRGTVFAFNGGPIGEPIEGDEFFDALLAIWLGPAPADLALRDALLGRSAR